MSNLNQLYRKYTGMLIDVEGAIVAAKTEQEKRDLYNKLTWGIPGGLVRKNYKDLLDELATRLIDSVSPAPEAPSTVIVEETPEEAPVVEEILDETPAEEPVVDECPLYEEAPVDEAAIVVEETPAVVETPTRRSRSSKVVEE
jgi:hypothetical protein